MNFIQRIQSKGKLTDSQFQKTQGASPEVAQMTHVLGLKPRVLYCRPKPYKYFGSLIALRPGNYFLYEKKTKSVQSSLWLITRLSRSKRPFWGLRSHTVELFQNEPNWLLVLLQPGERGWLYEKADVEHKIHSQQWRKAKDNEYKINHPHDAQKKFHTLPELRTKIETIFDINLKYLA